MELQSIIKYLADGQFHSGSDLGRALGVSRTSIWKSLGQLEEFGLELESIKGKGYRLLRPLDLLDEAKIKAKLSVSALKKLSLEILLTVDSTNNYLLSNAASVAAYECCLAEVQTSGKGRRGRQWVSPFASNIYLSMSFELAGGTEALSGLSLVVGLSVAKALKEYGVDGVELKWPNDVWLNGKKLAGILVELSGEATTSWRVVLGLGLNLNMSEEEGEIIDQPWISLSEVVDVDRNEIVSLLLEGLVRDMDVFKVRGFSSFISQWNEFDGLNGKDVFVNSEAVNGVARGVDSTGALLLEGKGGITAINAGEVSVRCV